MVHFEILGKDPEKLKGYYAELFGWDIDSNNPLNYGMVQREGNLTPNWIGIAGGIGAAPRATTATSSSDKAPNQRSRLE